MPTAGPVKRPPSSSTADAIRLASLALSRGCRESEVFAESPEGHGLIGKMAAMAVEEEVGRLLVTRGWHIAVAETSTGGFIGYLLTSVPGSSTYFDRSIVAYSNQAKETSLVIPPAMLQQQGAVSLLTVLAMATKVRGLSQVEVGLAVTGLTGPRIGRSAKPIGLTYIAIALPRVTLWWEGVIPGERTAIQRQSALKSLEMLRDALHWYAKVPKL
jgi:PncC family amidohydrolase